MAEGARPKTLLALYLLRCETIYAEYVLLCFMSKCLLSVFALCYLAGTCWGQSPYAGGQEVHYAIAAELDTTRHSLEVEMEMKYINHSRDTLNEIYLHLWANAYRDRSTTFARELLNRGETHFHFSAAEDRGGYERIEVKKGRDSLSLIPTENPDIGYLPLDQQLLPGDTVLLDFSYTLRIPLSFSRLGRTADSYQLTQWYPKPAVYKGGEWVTFPYADQGEFFSEFGRFEVELDAPADFLVLATGRPDSSSLARLKTVAGTKKHYAEYMRMRHDVKRQLWRYEADRVHDFALFLDRNFRLDSLSHTLNDGREVSIWAAYTPSQAEKWGRATEYMARALSFFSEEIGSYPYSHCTAVEGALSAGAGMEYPMITVIGESESPKELDRVLAHEIGHNWWYGILASNERKSAWIDEGLTSCYERLYMQKYYPKSKLTLRSFWKEQNWSAEDAVCMHRVHLNQWQNPARSSETFTPMNYYLTNYHWTPKMFLHLRQYMGAREFRAAIRRFYERYAFSHIEGGDLQAILEEESGQSLDWLFVDGLEKGAFPDYDVRNKRQLGDSVYFEIQNQTSVPSPFRIDFLGKDSLQIAEWSSGFSGRNSYRYAIPDMAQAIGVNSQKLLLESDFSNNTLLLSDGKSEVSSFQLGLLTANRSEHRKQLFILPSFRYTEYDNVSMGIIAHNLSIPNRALQFYLHPGVNPLSGGFSATGRMRWSTPILARPSQILFFRLGLDGRYMPYAEEEKEVLRYRKWSPYVQLDLQKSRYRHRMEIRWHNIDLDAARPEPSLGDKHTLTEVYYQGRWTHPLRRYKWESWTTFLPDHLRLGAKFSYRQAYAEKSYWSARLYAGWIPDNYETVPLEARLQAGRFSGVDDFRFSEHWIGRSATAGRGFHGLQSSQREGTLKSPFQPDFDISFLSTAEFRIDAPFRWLPLALYFDLGYVRGTDALSGSIIESPWLFSPGLSLSFFDRGLEIHLPLGFWDSDLIERNRPSAYDSWSWPVYVNFSFRWDMDLFFELDQKLLGE